MSAGPTWADVASGNRQTERRDVALNPDSLAAACPFCRTVFARRKLKRPTGHVCGCGALFYTHQAVAVHFKERE